MLGDRRIWWWCGGGGVGVVVAVVVAVVAGDTGHTFYYRSTGQEKNTKT